LKICRARFSTVQNREAVEREHKLRVAAEDAEAQIARKNHELRRVRNALQRELASRTEDVSQLTQELIASRQTLLAVKDELAAELTAMTRLHELSTRLLAATELQPLLEEVLDATIALLSADFGNVQLYDPKSRALKIIAQRGFQQEFLDYFDSVQEGAALELCERVIVEDVLTDPVFAPHLHIVAAAGYRAVQSTPLISRGGEMLGMISTHFREPRRPSERDLRFVDLYARQAAEMIERKRAEEALRASEERFRRYFDLGLIGMAITSPTKGCVEVNDELCGILGYERSELLQKTWAEMTHPDDLAADVAQFNRVMAGEIDGYTLDKRWIRRDGETIHTIMAAKCVRRGTVRSIISWGSYSISPTASERKKGCSAARLTWQRGRGLAIPAVGPGMFPLESSSGRGNIFASMASILRISSQLKRPLND
jgi:PAS domain S-box-containing protein